MDKNYSLCRYAIYLIVLLKRVTFQINGAKKMKWIGL